ncbi:MAG: sodium/proton-translocating pyrophosphatase, partial [Lutispora sp.]
MDLMLLAPISGVLALVFAWVLATGIMKKDPGNDRMKEIMGYIHEGAMAFLFREYKVLAIFIVVLAAV